MKTVAIYTRVSSEQQKENKTIESQVGALVNFAKEKGYSLPEYSEMKATVGLFWCVLAWRGYGTSAQRGRFRQYWFIARTG